MDLLEPDTSVKETGNVLLRLLQFIELVGTEYIVMLAKIYLYDGLWRIIVEEDSKWNFEYAMPKPPIILIRLVVESELQMRWAEIPA